MAELEMAFMSLIVFGSIASIVYLMHKTEMPKKLEVLEPCDAKFRAETNREFLIFWAVLFFTCVVGIIELLSLFEGIQYEGLLGRGLLSLLYFGLLAGMFFSMASCWNIYRENQALTFCGEGKLGKTYKEFVENNKTFVDRYGLTSIWYESTLTISVIVIFEILYFVILGWMDEVSFLTWEESARNFPYFMTAFTGAVFALFLSWLKEWWRRPKLKMELDFSACKPFTLGGGPDEEKYIRLKIDNKGRTPAEYCEAKIEPLNEKGESLFDPSILYWVRRYWIVQSKPEEAFEPIVINTKDSEYLAMLTLYKGRGRTNIEKIELRTASHRPYLFNPKTNYRLKVTIFAKNVGEPVPKTFSLFWDGTWDWFDEKTVRAV